MNGRLLWQRYSLSWKMIKKRRKRRRVPEKDRRMEEHLLGCSSKKKKGGKAFGNNTKFNTASGWSLLRINENQSVNQYD